MFQWPQGLFHHDVWVIACHACKSLKTFFNPPSSVALSRYSMFYPKNAISCQLTGGKSQNASIPIYGKVSCRLELYDNFKKVYFFTSAWP